MEFFFDDNDYNEVAAIERDFFGAVILLCIWHVLAYLKKLMVKLFGATRKQAYRSFTTVFLRTKKKYSNK